MSAASAQASCLSFRSENFGDDVSAPILSAFKDVDVPDYDIITNCMHCGLCLPQCPTYALSGLERSSPRGRIRLIKAVADGDLPITDGFVEEMNFCLDCQACETACPAGVHYGALVEAARTQIGEQMPRWHWKRLMKSTLLDWLFAKTARLKSLASLIRAAERLRLTPFLRESRLMGRLFPRIQGIVSLAPPVSSRFSSDELPHTTLPKGPPRFRVGFLTGCIMDVSFSDVNSDTVRLLLHHHCEVVAPKGQGCCGSLQAHNGEMSTARRLARQLVESFAAESLDYVIMNSAGCGAFMKEYGKILEGEDVGEEAKKLAHKVKDITEFLAETGLRVARGDDDLPKAFEGKRVTYHDACHLVHSQKISRQPRELIRQVPGVEYIELPEATWCCGSAGIYNIVRYEDSMKLLNRKIECIKKAKPDILVTGNPGCLVQIQHGLRDEGMNIELLHTATFLRKACNA